MVKEIIYPEDNNQNKTLNITYRVRYWTAIKAKQVPKKQKKQKKAVDTETDETILLPQTKRQQLTAELSDNQVLVNLLNSKYPNLNIIINDKL